MADSLFREIKRKRIIKRIIASIAVLVLVVSSYFLYLKVFKAFADPVDVLGNSITFNSGYYSVDSAGNVYAKTGSEIADTDDDMFPFVSYLSDPYPDEIDQLNLFGKDVTVTGTATVLMEGNQTFASLTLGAGGTISQPQPDRDGYINRYQYSDQEWAIEFQGFIKVPAGEQRKLTCATDYHNGDGGNPIGNGCLVQYTTLESDLDEVALWTDFDKVWQTGVGTWDTSRYTALGTVINNPGGSDEYYPVRIIFKDDFIDDRDEDMEIYLRDAANNIINQAGGASALPVLFSEGTIYGATSTGLVDTSAPGEMRFNYYLADKFEDTPLDQSNTIITDDLSDAYKTYSNSAIEMSSFFDDGYGEDPAGDGYFDLVFDDTESWDGTKGSSPFAKGTTGAIDEEAYKNYAYSTKTVNPNIDSGETGRYIRLGLELSILSSPGSGILNLAGGAIDLSGKGYPGYSYEMLSINDTDTFITNRGSGPTIGAATYGGGKSGNNVGQAGAHTKNGGGIVSDSDDYAYGVNSSTYDDKEAAAYAGSGGGASTNGDEISSHGGNGGGLLTIRASEIDINSTNNAFDVSGEGGYLVGSGRDNYSGGSGGSVNIATRKIDQNVTFGASHYLAKADGGNNTDGTLYTGGSGGLIKIFTNEYFKDGASISQITNLSSMISYIGATGTTSSESGENGEEYISIDPDAGNITPDSASKELYIDGISTEIVRKGQSGNLEINVPGMSDATTVNSNMVDLVLVVDLSGSMYGSRLNYTKFAVKEIIDKVVTDNGSNGADIRIGLVTYTSLLTPPFNPLIDDSDILSKDKTVLNSYKTNVDNYQIQMTVGDEPAGGTAMGSGIQSAVDMLTDPFENEGREDANKFILLMSDGEENILPCTCDQNDVGPNGTATPVGEPAEDNCTGRIGGVGLENPPNHTGNPPVSGSPLDQVYQAGIGMVSVGIGITDSYLATYLEALAEYANHNPSMSNFHGNNYYSVDSEASNISQSLSLAFRQMTRNVNPTSFILYEQMPAGTVIDRSNIKVYNNGDTEISNSGCTVFGNNYVECEIEAIDYDENSPYDDDFKFIFPVKFENVAFGRQDIDQNSLCDTEPPEYSSINSKVVYSPYGVTLGPTSIPTEIRCINFMPTTTFKKDLSIIYSKDDPNNPEDDSPYSLAEGDLVKVTITASPLYPGEETTIKDDYLKYTIAANDYYYCDGNDILIDSETDISPPPTSESIVPGDNYIEFTFNPSSVKETLSYLCKVKHISP